MRPLVGWVTEGLGEGGGLALGMAFTGGHGHPLLPRVAPRPCFQDAQQNQGEGRRVLPPWPLAGGQGTWSTHRFL